MKPNPKIVEVEQIDADQIVVVFTDGTLGRYSAKVLASLTQGLNPPNELGATLHLLNEYCASQLRRDSSHYEPGVHDSAHREEAPALHLHWPSVPTCSC